MTAGLRYQNIQSNLNLDILHQRIFRWIHSHSAVGLPSGKMATIGGWEGDTGDLVEHIYLLENDQWVVSKPLLQVNFL